MAVIGRLRVGQVLHDYHKYRMGNTTMSAMGHWQVKVLEIDLPSRRALCSWNGNSPTWYGEKQLGRLKVHAKKPGGPVRG